MCEVMRECFDFKDMLDSWLARNVEESEKLQWSRTNIQTCEELKVLRKVAGRGQCSVNNSNFYKLEESTD